MTLCVQDEVCNRKLVPFVQSCSAPQCEERLCRLAARHFYSSLPEKVAEMLVFCQCMTDDQDCQHFQTLLNSNSCKQDKTEQWNCLEMLDNCTEEKICRFGCLCPTCLLTFKTIYFATLHWFICTFPILSPSALSIEYQGKVDNDVYSCLLIYI